MKVLIHGTFAVVALLVLACAAQAGIVSTAGNMVVFSPATADYTAAAYNDAPPAPTHLWVEQSGISLPSDVVLDTDLADPTKRYVISGAGVNEVAFGPASGPTLPAGTFVEVYYAYFDPAGTQSGTGSVTFDREVLGIVAYTERLQFSDFLRVAGAPYPADPAFNARGWEASEWGQLSADRKTLTFFGNASNPGDQFRIFVSGVPEPSSYGMLALGIFGMFLTGVRRRALRK